MRLHGKEDVALRLEALKLTQASLQQVMTLSGAGLALFFSFISKAPFLTSLRVIGIFVVLLWILALCAAAIAHRIVPLLFQSLRSLHSVTESLHEEVPSELKLTIAKTQGDTRTKAITEAKEFRSARNKLYDDYSPNLLKTIATFDRRILLYTNFAVFSLSAGFVVLALGYVLWVIS
jgi:hypothetical protein